MLQSMVNFLMRRSRRLKAELAGVNGFTGRGKIYFQARKSGAHALAVQLNGVAGRNADIFSNDQQVVRIPIDNGRAGKRYRANTKQALPELTEGGLVEIRQNGDVILSGFLARD